jgi:hypothetical protein
LLKDCSVLQIEPIKVSHPAKLQFDTIRQHASLIECDNGSYSS